MHILSSYRAACVKAPASLRRIASLILVCLIFAGCDAPPSPPDQTNGAEGASANDNVKAGMRAGDKDRAERAAASPVFNPSAEQIDKAFAAGESLAKMSGKRPFGEGKVLDIPVQRHKSLKISIFFMPPLVEARNKGYDFGKRPGGTPADRAAVIGLVNKNLHQDVTFYADLPISDEVHKDDNASLPTISFELLDHTGKRVEPREQPGFQIPLLHDLLASNERWVSFHLHGEGAPHLTDKMDTLTLAVRVGDEEQQLVFRLK
jgi:hypothetical protein